MGGGVLRARGDRLSEVDRLEDGLGVIEDGRLGDMLDVVREECLGARARGAVGGAVGADVPAGSFGEADALLLPLGTNAARGFDEEEKKSPMLLDVDCIIVVAATLLNPAFAGGVVEGALALRAAGSTAYDLDAELFSGVLKAIEVSNQGRAAAVLL